MGAGASAENAYASTDNNAAEKEAELEKLKAHVQAQKQTIDSLQEDVRRASLSEKADVPKENATGKQGKKVGKLAKQKTRRGEISAEVCEAEAMLGLEVEFFDKSEDEQLFIKEAMDQSILFANISEDEKKTMVKAFKKEQAKAGTNVIVQDEGGNEFYIIYRGVLEVWVTDHHTEETCKTSTLEPEDSFGELALMYNTPRAATITAKTDCCLWSITRQAFNTLHKQQEMQQAKMYKEFLKKIPGLETLSVNEASKLAAAMQEVTYAAGDTIIREGEIGNHFFIIRDGEAEYSKKDEGVVGSARRGDYFGHRALMTDEVRQATVVALTDVTCLTLERQEFVHLLGEFHEFENRVQSQSEAENNRNNTLLSKNKYQKDIHFEDLEKTFERDGRKREVILGQGAFGTVQIVKHRTTGETFALKTLSKSGIVEYGLESHVVDERRVMVAVDHPALLKLYNSFWDKSSVYFLLELCLGGELFTILQKEQKFKERRCKFYSASVLQGLAHMHERSIAYRDLKPENLVLDDNGYLKIIDFGLAKVILNRSWTLCGTPDYLAPEIIQTTGHDKAVDYWALGVLIYEFSVGYAPFYADNSLESYERIIAEDPKFPSSIPKPMRSLISKLLNKNQLKRLGNTKNGVKDIFRHMWFAGFDWDALLKREMEPPYIPTVSSTEDTSNFDKFDVHQDMIESPWEPAFPYQIIDGITQFDS